MGLPAIEIEDDIFNPRKKISANELSLNNIFESYIRYYAGGNDHTARAKRLDIKHFLDFLCLDNSLSKHEKLKLKHWNYTSVQRFVEKSLQSGESPSTVARRLATIKHIGRTFAEKVPGFINPAREVKSPKINTAIPKAISKPEIKLIKNKAKDRQREKDSFNRLRNKTLLDFLLDTGLRAEEVRLLKLGQIDEKLEWIHNVRTKGRRYRNVYITSAMRPILTEYLKIRELKLKSYFPKLSKSINKQLPLFISVYNAKASKPETFLMGAKSIWRAVAELSANTHLHPHLLRHSYALDLLKHSKDVRLVSQALGHSDVRVTMRYTERQNQEIAEALEKSRKSN